ncbi:hypothetical protein HANVADRAFT_62118 [Hanseniaspora valbyensis NRRL Y-1626]|uniref:RRM domain-containing protein n=1 Tax=Hanseniaspora valbyensis NRRL Y-1626 TaxID=766949 RepID=A0A1B7TF99_9ASCO|nr:hypothetical protein HANVADRAFT_62118 [Hanseniaspora valbyensis NRRL Y-1626]
MSGSNNNKSFNASMEYMSLMTNDNKLPQKQYQYDDVNQARSYNNGRISPLTRLIIDNNENNSNSNSSNATHTINATDTTSTSTTANTINNNNAESCFNSMNNNFPNKPNSSASVPLIADHNQILNNSVLSRSAGVSYSITSNSNNNNNMLMNDGIYLQRSNSAIQMGSNTPQFYSHYFPQVMQSPYENPEIPYSSHFNDHQAYQPLDNLQGYPSIDNHPVTPLMMKVSQHQYQLYNPQQQQQQQYLQHSQNQINSFSQGNVIYKYEMIPDEYMTNNMNTNKNNNYLINNNNNNNNNQSNVMNNMNQANAMNNMNQSNAMNNMNQANAMNNMNQANVMNNFYSGNNDSFTSNISKLSRPNTPTADPFPPPINTQIIINNNNNNDISPVIKKSSSLPEIHNNEPEPTRTLLLTNIPSTTTSKTILNHVKLGIIQQLLILPENINNENKINNSTINDRSGSNSSQPDTVSCKLTFLNLQHAIEFYYDAMLKKLTIDNRQIHVSYTQEQPIGPLTMQLLNMPEYKPTRNLFISGLYDQPNEETLHKRLLLDLFSFGPIDHIKIIFKKGIAFIHFLDIEDCIKVFLSLKNFSKYYETKKIGFGRDRCEFVTITEKYNATVASYPSLLSNGNKYFGDGNRTIFLGNLPPLVTMTDICNTIRGGTLEKINLISEKNICFITFVDPVAAFNFHSFYEQQSLVILNKKIKVSWGKHSGELKPLLKLAILKGASRNIYIGGLKLGKYFNKDNKKETFSEFNIRKKFGKFGELEQINFLVAKDCFFVNFAEIQSAIECLDKIRDDPLYKNLQVNFGKDRVANRPRH